MKCMINEWIRDILEEENALWDRRTLRKEVWSDWEEFGEVKRQKQSREIGEKWRKKRANPLYRNPSFSMDQEVSRIKKARNSYREVSIAKGPRWIEKLLSIYQAYRNFLDGLSRCSEAIQIKSQESRWIEFAIITIEKRSSKGSIDSLVVERYREVVEIA